MQSRFDDCGARCESRCCQIGLARFYLFVRRHPLRRVPDGPANSVSCLTATAGRLRIAQFSATI